jgi:AraC-like DNA-binding protein
MAFEAKTRGATVGIGGTHNPQEVQLSYLEANTALRAAQQSGQPVVSYIDLGALPSQRRFPVEARDEFLLEFKHVHSDAARRRLQLLLDQMALHAEGDAVAYRVRLLELLGAVLGVVGEQAGDNHALLTETASAFEQLNHLEGIDELTDAFTTMIDKLQRRVQTPPVEITSGNPLQCAKAYIEENLAEDLKVGEVAKRAGVSTTQLQRVFRETLGMTYSTYLTTMRIQKAKELLAGTDRPITDIAFDVGYNDSTYFSTAFRKHEGLSPRQYRKQGSDFERRQEAGRAGRVRPGN